MVCITGDLGQHVFLRLWPFTIFAYNHDKLIIQIILSRCFFYPYYHIAFPYCYYISVDISSPQQHWLVPLLLSQAPFPPPTQWHVPEESESLFHFHQPVTAADVFFQCIQSDPPGKHQLTATHWMTGSPSTQLGLLNGLSATLCATPTFEGLTWHPCTERDRRANY